MKLHIIDKRMFKYIDWLLFANIILLILLSFIAIASALSEPLADETGSLSAAIAQLDLYYVFQQLSWFGVGLFAMFIVLLPDYHAIGEYYKWIYVIIIALLVAVYLFGTEVNGTKGWFRIGNSGFSAERAWENRNDYRTREDDLCPHEGQGWRDSEDTGHTAPSSAHFVIPLLLILIQPDWGTALVYAFTFISMLFIAKTSLKIIIGLFVCAGIAAPVAWLLMADWQKERIYGFLQIPMEGMSDQEIKDMTYQSDQAKIAAGSGQVTGKGLFSMGGGKPTE